MSKDFRCIPRLCYDDKLVDFVDEAWMTEPLFEEEIPVPVEHQLPAPEDFPGDFHSAVEFSVFAQFCMFPESKKETSQMLPSQDQWTDLNTSDFLDTTRPPAS